MIKYKVIDNFISSNECDNLIYDAEKLLDDIGGRQILNNNRELTSSTSLNFFELLKSSNNWYNINSKLSSQDFINDCFDRSDVNPKKFILSNFYNLKKLTGSRKKFKELQNKKTNYLSTISLIKIIIYRAFLNIQKFFKYNISTKYYGELIYDFSKAQNGYKREIHRDSDSRTLVFLLYLNDLDSNAKGGSLNIYNFIGDDKDNIPSRPRLKDCKLIEKIEPKKGKLIIFLNSDDSLHSVEEMIGHKNFRYFIYGSFTLLGKRSPLLKNDKEKLKTEFHLFD